ncbi:ATP-binding cassette domain-containing protein [bacterium]|nr:ATP-binding cassette domain-containing protein [bacterium]
MIESLDINKSYGHLHVLKGVSCRINQGEVVSIVGPSGAGKSTLLHIMGTLDQPDSGQILFNGQSPRFDKPRQLAAFRNKSIGFVFQFHHLLPEFTALENICIPAFIAKTDKAQAEKKAGELLKIMGLAQRSGHYPGQLSGGEQQRVAVARALINQPSVVLADEPSGNLDSQSAEELHKLFFSLRNELGQTFVIVTHNTELAEMTDRTLHMNDGKITEA